MSPVSCNHGQCGKTCPRLQKWHEAYTSNHLLYDWIQDLFQRTKHLPGAAIEPVVGKLTGLKGEPTGFRGEPTGFRGEPIATTLDNNKTLSRFMSVHPWVSAAFIREVALCSEPWLIQSHHWSSAESVPVL